MAQEKSAKLAATSDLSPLARRLQSAFLRTLVSPGTRARRRRMDEWRRRLHSGPRVVHYFHQADDPYSQLAAQRLGALAASYEVELSPHLVGPNRGANNPEPELLAGFARRDAAAVAPHYGLAFDDPGQQPPPEAVQLAERLLVAALERGDFAERAATIGEALWSGAKERLERLAEEHPPASPEATEAARSEGDALRAKLRHYSSATLHYAGEWYWGVDRLPHLETRLAELGARRAGAEPVITRPPIDPGPMPDDGRLTLEFFPSLRSPYTAVIYDKALELAERSGVRLRLRPVLPMVMRGVPATFAKGLYIFSDALREAEALGVPFGNMVDPIGRPVERAYSLFPWAQQQGKGGALLSSFLRGAFAEGVNTSTDAGMRAVVESAGLSWAAAQPYLDSDDWRDELEANRLAMYDELGLWGVPSFRVSGPAGEPDYGTWGQDRLWLVAAEIRRRIALAR